MAPTLFDFSGPCGPVAVRPEKVVMVTATALGCELLMSGGGFIILTNDAYFAASKLWERPIAVPNGYICLDHIQSISDHTHGSRIILSENITIDTLFHSQDLIDSVRRFADYQGGLNLQDAMIGHL